MESNAENRNNDMKLAWILIFGFYVVLAILIYARLIYQWWRRFKSRYSDDSKTADRHRIE